MQIIPKLCGNPGWEVPLDHGREFRVDRWLKPWRLHCHSVFLAALLHCFYYSLGCAATLVASNWAITAAHCVVDSGFTSKDDLSLVLGEFDISTLSDSNDGNRLKI